MLQCWRRGPRTRYATRPSFRRASNKRNFIYGFLYFKSQCFLHTQVVPNSDVGEREHDLRSLALLLALADDGGTVERRCRSGTAPLSSTLLSAQSHPIDSSSWSSLVFLPVVSFGVHCLLFLQYKSCALQHIRPSSRIFLPHMFLFPLLQHNFRKMSIHP
jgi:hypothetical protein